MDADRKQQNSFGAAVLHELEDDAQIIAGTGGPTVG